jgi:hypothetical protein
MDPVRVEGTHTMTQGDFGMDDQGIEPVDSCHRGYIARYCDQSDELMFYSPVRRKI